MTLLKTTNQRQYILDIFIRISGPLNFFPKHEGTFLCPKSRSPENSALPLSKSRCYAIVIIVFTYLRYFVSVVNDKIFYLSFLVTQNSENWPPVIQDSSGQRIWIHYSTVQFKCFWEKDSHFLLLSSVSGGWVRERHRLYPLLERSFRVILSL